MKRNIIFSSALFLFTLLIHGISARNINIVEVFDGTVNTGNERFYFLPELVPNPTFSGTFDASLKPEIEICLFEDGICQFPAIARYEFNDKKGVTLNGNHYQMNWKPSENNLDPTSLYQVRILVDGLVMGFIVVSGDVNNKTVPIKFRLEEGCTNCGVIGREGGTITTPDGCCSLDIPKGALSNYVGITMLPYNGDSRFNLIPGPPYEFGPDGLEFALPVSLTICYDESMLAQYPDENTLMLFTLDELGWTPMFVGTVDPNSNTLQAELEHFTDFGVGSLQAQLDACVNNNIGCQSLGEAIRKQIDELECQCRASMNYEDKLVLWNQILDFVYYPEINDELKRIIGTKYLNSNDACGGLFDEEHTYIYQYTLPDFERPPGTDLELHLGYEDNIQIFAEIRTRICDYDDDGFAYYCSPEFTIEGDLHWGTQDKEIADIDDNGFVTTKNIPGDIGIVTYLGCSSHITQLN